MKKNTIIISGVLLLIMGIAIGWLLKPAGSQLDHQHVESPEQTSQEKIWTCSMHPQIRQPEPGICPICEMDLIPMDNTFMGNDDPTLLQMSNEAVKLAQIETYTVGGNSAEKQEAASISVDGTIELDERRVQAQPAHVGGRIETMSVTFEGQYVSKGQPIATIYSTELLAASEELITATKFNQRIEGIQDAAVQKLKNWKVTDDQIQAIIKDQKPITTVSVYADYSGYVLKKVVSQGDYVRTGEMMYTLGSTGNLWLIFQVFESDLAEIRKGQKVQFTTPSLPGRTFESRITYINPILNNQSRTGVVRAEINNPGSVLKPGMLIEGTIFSNRRTSSEEGITIPNSAILWTGDRSVVYVKLPEEEIPTYQFREVTVRDRGNQYSTVTAGIEIGDEIVMEGAFAVDAAAQLNNNFSMMNRDITIKSKVEGDQVPDFSEQVSGDFLNSLDKVVAEYLTLKNALVSTNSTATAAAAQKMLSVLGEIDGKGLAEEAKKFWDQQGNAMQVHGEKIAKFSKDVEAQRDEFEFLSEALINTLKAFGTNDEEYFVQYCPMAKNNQGASWLSAEEKVQNPYFGDKMMKCGVVKLVLN